MGRPKLLLPWGERTILAYLVQQWRELGAMQIAVVIEGKSPLIAHLAEVDSIVNLQPELGMFSSVQCAARWGGWRPELTHFVITLGDQPHVGIQTLKAIMNFAGQHPDCVCQPSRKGRPRHPVVLPKGTFLEVARAKGGNLKEFLRARESQRRLLEMEDAALDVDLDTPEDYERMVKLLNS